MEHQGHAVGTFSCGVCRSLVEVCGPGPLFRRFGGIIRRAWTNVLWVRITPPSGGKVRTLRNELVGEEFDEYADPSTYSENQNRFYEMADYCDDDVCCHDCEKVQRFTQPTAVKNIRSEYHDDDRIRVFESCAVAAAERKYLRKLSAANRIKLAFKIAYWSPKYAICRRRLQREFEQMTQ